MNLQRGTRHLIACNPAGFERYFARMAAERRGEEPPEWALQPIPESIVVGPRIGERDLGSGSDDHQRR